MGLNIMKKRWNNDAVESNKPTGWVKKFMLRIIFPKLEEIDICTSDIKDFKIIESSFHTSGIKWQYSV